MKVTKCATSISKIKSRSSMASTRGSFSSNIKKCWNGSSRPTSTTSKPTPPPSQQQTTCLLCSDIVLLPQFPNGNCDANFREVIANLCTTFSIKLQGQCTPAMFPLCALRCKPIVSQLWKQQKDVLGLMQRIERTITAIEKTVREAEVMAQAKVDNSMTVNEPRKFTQLTDAISAAYRAKLLKKHLVSEQDSSVEDDNASSSHSSINGNDSGVECEGSQSEKMQEPKSRMTIKQEYFDEVDGSTMGIVKSSVLQEEYPDFTFVGHQVIVGSVGEQEQDYFEMEATEISVDPNTVAVYDSLKSRVVITSENAESDVVSLVQIKQEAHLHVANENDDEHTPPQQPHSFKALPNSKDSRKKRVARNKGISVPTNKSFECNFCGRSFAKSCNLGRHITCTHRDKLASAPRKQQQMATVSTGNRKNTKQAHGKLPQQPVLRTISQVRGAVPLASDNGIAGQRCTAADGTVVFIRDGLLKFPRSN